MVTTLKLVFRTPRFVLIAKAFLLTLFFSLAASPDAGFFWTIVFFVTALYYYAHAPFNHLAYSASFVVLLALALILPQFFDTLPLLLFVPCFLAWYILFGLQSFILMERWWWHYFLFVLLSYGVILWYVFRLDVGGGVLFSTIALIVALSLLLHELWGAQLADSLSLRKRLTIISTTLLLLLQCVWVFRLLPLPTSLVAAIALFALALFAECVVRFYSVEQFGTFFIRRCAFFIGFVALVFLTSRWSP